MKKTSDELQKGSASATIKGQEIDLRLEISELEAQLHHVAKRIAARSCISMVDYSDYNRLNAALKERTDHYLGFTKKFMLSLR